MPVKIDDEKCPIYWGTPLQKLMVKMQFDVLIGKDPEEAYQSTRQFFSAFFRVNPTIGSLIRGYRKSAEYR